MKNVNLYACFISALMALSSVPCFGMELMRQLYWHERVSFLSPKQQKQSFLLADLKKAINKAQVITYNPLYCWDILLNVPAQKQTKIMQKLKILIQTYNRSLATLPINHDALNISILKINHFIHLYQPKKAKTNRILNRLRIKAHQKAMHPYLTRPYIIIPACIAGIAALSGSCAWIYARFKKHQTLLPKPPVQEQLQTPLLLYKKNNAISLPSAIKKFNKDNKGFIMTHLHVALQEGLSCSWHTVFNALGMHKLLSQKNSISLQALNQYTKNNIENFKKENNIKSFDTFIAGSAMRSLISKHKLPNFNILGRDENGLVHINTDRADHLGYTAADLDPNLFLKTLDQIRNTTNGEFYFACNLGSVHWTLLAIIKRAQLPLHIVYLDSMNWAIDDNVQDYITKIYDGIYYPEKLKKELEEAQLRVNSNQPLIKGQKDSFIPLPKNFAAFNQCAIGQIHAKYQAKAPSSWHAIFYAREIDAMLRGAKTIDIENMRKQAVDNLQNHIDSNQNIDHVKNKLPHWTDLVLHNGTIQSQFSTHASLDAAIKSIGTQEEGESYFLCHYDLHNSNGVIDNHSALISIIKRKNNRILMLYIDPMNISLENNPQAQQYITALYNGIFGDTP